MSLSRRVIVLASVTGVTAAGVISLDGLKLLGPYYTPTPYDDLLHLLPNREMGKIVGRAFLTNRPKFTPANAATKLRAHVQRPLTQVLAEEVRHDELSMAGGWIMPATLLGLCALAATT